MDKIIPSYSDPLFSIFIIVLLILVVATVSFFVGNYKESIDKRYLKKFIGAMSIEETNGFNIDDLNFSKNLVEPLFLVAKSLANSGDYRNSILIYIYLIEHLDRFYEQEPILVELGNCYLRAGFLTKAERTYLEILRKHPRNIDVLYNLEFVYELLHDYSKAKDVLLPLETLDEDVNRLKVHIELSSVINSLTVKHIDRVEQISRFVSYNFVYRRVIKALFHLDAKMAWRVLRVDRVEEILDILWLLPSSNLDLDIIYSSDILKSIYIAKGILELEDGKAPISNIFTVDTINYAKEGGCCNLDISFSYICCVCKQHFPLSFDRCPRCYSIDSLQIKDTISKKELYSGFSLL